MRWEKVDVKGSWERFDKGLDDGNWFLLLSILGIAVAFPVIVLILAACIELSE